MEELDELAEGVSRMVGLSLELQPTRYKGVEVWANGEHMYSLKRDQAYDTLAFVKKLLEASMDYAGDDPF